jgi:ankyrin repeat protein
VLDPFKNFFNTIFSASSSILLASEKKDSNVDAQFFAAIKSKDVGKVKEIIERDSLVLGQKDLDGDTPIFSALKSGNLEIVKAIIEKNPLVLEQKNLDGYTPFFYAILSGQTEIFEAIIEKNPLVLEQKDLDGDAPIFYALKSGNLEIVKAIIEKNPLVLEQKDLDGDTPIFYAILSEQTEIVEAIIEKNPLVLEQKDLDGDTPFFCAIKSLQTEIVKAIIEKNPLVLKQKDSKGNTIFHAALILMSSNRENEDKVSEILKTILHYQFPGPIIDEASQEDFKELFLKKMLLKGIYSKEEVPFDFECLEKAFDKITPENTFKKIYQELFEKVNKNQSISSKNNEEMFIFQSKLKNHESFFIFHVNKEDGKLTSISYCDGHTIDEGRRIKGSATHINGVTTFKLKTPIEYSYENFVKDFINENTKDKSVEVFKNKFREKKLYFKGSRIEFSEITHSIPTRVQKRGNCVFKSSSVLARKISEQQNPAMAYYFNSETKTPYGSGYDEHKKFKNGLTKNALDFIIKMKEKISSESPSFSDYLRKEIEDVMEMVARNINEKLWRIQPKEDFHKTMRGILSLARKKKEIASPETFFSEPYANPVLDITKQR